MNAPTKAQAEAALQILVALAEAIRDLGTVPAGHLYAQVMGQLDLPSFDAAIGQLIGAGLIERDGHLLKWKGARAK
jgi:hypothetical protein